MNGDPFRTTTREEIERVFGADLDRDEGSHIEEMRDDPRPLIRLAIISLVALCCFLLLAACTETTARDDLAPLTSIRPEPRP